MKIIGKNKGKLVIKCDGGHLHLYNTYGTGSGCFGCEHEKGETLFDFVNISELKEVDI